MGEPVMSVEAANDQGLDDRTKLSIYSTDLTIENTIMAADRTQMSVLNSSLSLIGFGFTIFKFFQEVGRQTQPAVFGPPARNFGLLLVLLGIFLLLAGMFNRIRVVRSIEQRRQALHDQGLSLVPPKHSISPNMAVSVMLLIGGVLVVLGIVARTGPFG
jgi:putative membrane protein